MARSNGVHSLEFGDLKVVFEASRPDEERQDDSEPEDEEYVEGDDDDDMEDDEEREAEEPLEDGEPRELDFKGEVSLPAHIVDAQRRQRAMEENSRPLQLNKEYDAWSAQMAPPVFEESDDE